MKRIELHLLRISLLTLFLASLVSLGSCFFDTKTTLCESSELRCKPGQTCAAEQAACIDVGGCGDGIRSGDEVCDDGNVMDGDNCSADCLSNEVCGNGIVDRAAGEFCDYAVPDTYNCSQLCELQACGNLILDPGEACDSGGENSSTCDLDCTAPTCGDGRFNAAAEACDPGDGLDHFDCDSDCTSPICGDRYTNSTVNPGTGAPLETCDLGGEDHPSCNGRNNVDGQGNCQIPRCGDGYLNPTFRPRGINTPVEGCDAGENTETCNGNDHDADDKDDYEAGETLAAGNCQAPRCGDGYANPLYKPSGNAAETEECDTVTDSATCNGNRNNNGRGNCQLPQCGDGYLNTLFTPPGGEGAPEFCDAGGNTANCNGNDNDNGKGNCQEPSCGDGYFNSQNQIGSNREQCDHEAEDPDAPCALNEYCSQSCQCEDGSSISSRSKRRR